MNNVKRIIILFLGLVLNVSCSPKEKKLFFFEDFQHSELAGKHWNFELGDGCPELCGWGNNELQIYTKTNVEVKDGFLIIRADKKGDHYYSGKITTKNKVEFTYGTVEVRAKLPRGKGVWPAIWMLGSNIDEAGWPAAGEIDIMEYVGKSPGEIHTTLHTPESFGNTVNTKVTQKEDIERGFHSYKMDWTKDAIRFFIDEEMVYEYSPPNKDKDTWPFKQNFYLILNLAIGGNLGGPEIDESIFPVEFIIDYIKIYS